MLFILLRKVSSLENAVPFYRKNKLKVNLIEGENSGQMSISAEKIQRLFKSREEKLRLVKLERENDKLRKTMQDFLNKGRSDKGSS